MKNKNKNKNKVVLVLLDAFRGDYIDPHDTPFLFQLAKRNTYYKKLVPSFGFCERTEILVGLDANESLCFTAFGFEPLKSPYRNFNFFFSLLETLENSIKSKLFSKVLRRVIWFFFSKRPGTYFPFQIPLSFLPKFCLTEDGINNHIKNNPISIYKISNKVFNGSSTSMSEALYENDQQRLVNVIENINTDCDFFPIYISSLDVVGHQFGPYSKELKLALSELDSLLEDFYNKICWSYPDINIIFCGDHGMSPVKNKVNLLPAIESFSRKFSNPNQFNFFLDSTMCRFWFDGIAKDQIGDLINLIEALHKQKGFFVFREEFENLNIPDSRLYGDLIWLCNEGTIISPDFFNSPEKTINGMHGYIPLNDNHYGFSIVVSNQISQHQEFREAQLKDIYTVIRNHLIL